MCIRDSGTISRLLVSASWVANVTFKLPPNPALTPLLHSFPLRLCTVHRLQTPFLCNCCFLPPVLFFRLHFDSKGMIFEYSRLFPFVSLHDLLNCLGLLTFMHYCVLPLLLHSLFPSPSFWVFSRGWCFMGFTPLPVMATLVKTFFLSSFSSYLFTP